MKELFGSLDDLLKITHPINGNFLFRGHSSADYKLIPSIGRNDRKYKSTFKIEKILFNRFKLLSKSIVKDSPDYDLDWLILARHYGLRTRLLDWTKNIYVALYFSLLNRSQTKNEPFSIIIYRNPSVKSYFDLRKKDPFKINSDVFFEPPHIDDRISNQESILSIHFNPFIELKAPDLIQFNLYPTLEHIDNIETELIRVGIKHSTIYPGLDGIAKHINENPTELNQRLNLDRTNLKWKPVSKGMIGKTVGEINRLLIKERSFLANLYFHSSNLGELIGIPVSQNDKIIGQFRSFIPSEETVIVLNSNGKSKIVMNLKSESVKKLKIPDEFIKMLYPKPLVFRRPIK